ncbi:MAG: OmpA family protein, partial [Prevotellaceae bacterium]|nr:OmpA family protein [Prevotellaceae bacterium]
MNVNNISLKKLVKLKIFICSIILLLYSVPSHSTGFTIPFLFGKKKQYPHDKSCLFHISHFTLPPAPKLEIYDRPTFKLTVIYDVDGDGIHDQYDNCPASYGLPSLRGCPPINLKKTVTYGNYTVYLKNSDFNLLVEIFSNLNFEGEKQSLDAQSKKQLNKLIAFLKREKKLYIYISSYVDFDSNRKRNYYLSELRVDAIYSYLTKNGI